MSLLFDDETLVKKASYLRIAARDLAEGLKSGSFRSLYRGQGIEFAGVRDYIRGDDIRSIDWNVTARMGRPYVKLFEEERELQIFILLDTSLSMQTGSSKLKKLSKSAETAALLTIAAELNSCPIGAIFFDGEIYFTSEPKSGRNQTLYVLSNLDKIEQNGTKGTVLANAISGASRILRKRSLVFVISDFRAADWEKPIITLAQKNDVVALRLYEDSQNEIPLVGTAPFKDAESGISMMIPTTNPNFQKEWKKYHENLERRWYETCIKHGIYPAKMNTNDEPLSVLNGIFANSTGKSQGR